MAAAALPNLNEAEQGPESLSDLLSDPIIADYLRRKRAWNEVKRGKKKGEVKDEDLNEAVIGSSDESHESEADPILLRVQQAIQTAIDPDEFLAAIEGDTVDENQADGNNEANDGNQNTSQTEAKTPEVPDDCLSWFDGCNRCRRGAVGGPLACTRMFCQTPRGEPKCMDEIADSVDNINIVGENARDNINITDSVIGGNSGDTTIASVESNNQKPALNLPFDHPILSQYCDELLRDSGGDGAPTGAGDSDEPVEIAWETEEIGDGAISDGAISDANETETQTDAAISTTPPTPLSTPTGATSLYCHYWRYHHQMNDNQQYTNFGNTAYGNSAYSSIYGDPNILLKADDMISLSILSVLSILGTIYLWKMCMRPRCHCGLCKGVYNLGEKLQAGGYGEVYLVQARGFGGGGRGKFKIANERNES
jgi:hypothetical protein